MCKFDVPKSNPKLPECKQVMSALKEKSGRVSIFSSSTVVMEGPHWTHGQGPRVSRNVHPVGGQEPLTR